MRGARSWLMRLMARLRGQHREGPVIVLLVEDEPQAAEAMRRALEGAGFAVAWHVSGEGALGHVRQGLRPAAVVADEYLTGPMRGLEVLRHLSVMLPRVVRVLVTGYPDTAMMRDAVGVAHGAFVKPFEMADLVAALVARLRGQPRLSPLTQRLEDSGEMLAWREATARHEAACEHHVQEMRLLTSEAPRRANGGA